MTLNVLFHTVLMIVPFLLLVFMLGIQIYRTSGGNLKVLTDMFGVLLPEVTSRPVI